ncbi:unnamed protein product [Cladocopium goreaui]|uniref:Uncharacterized protein n=1 Tax=Cladocopium goreaui TaxID=2562237 RepID=A0A9P1FYX3_9DINO|nr:unnamed protein product [Cladocopium goreaui]
MDPSDDIRKLEGHLELIENILAHAGDDADGAQMVNEQFQACNELRPNLETAAEIVLDQDDGAALFSQITNVLERLENMEREWKTRKNSRPRVLSETSAAPSVPPPPIGTTGTQGSGASQPFPAASPVSSDHKSDKEKDGASGAFPSFPASSWPQETAGGASNFAAFDSTWGNWGDASASAWPAEATATGSASLAPFPTAGFDAGGGWPAEESGAAAAAGGTGGAMAAASVPPGPGLATNATPSPTASPAVKARQPQQVGQMGQLGGLGGLGSGSMQSLSSNTSTSLQLHIKCSGSDLEEVQRDQDRFKQRFVRAAAKAAGVPEYRIRVKNITNV